MLPRVHLRQLHAARRNGRSFLPSVVIGLGIWIGFPTVAAFQDMQSLVSGLEGSNARWNSYVETSVAGSVHAAEMPFVDANIRTGSISGAGMMAPGIGAVSLRSKGVDPDATPDEDRVVRGEKQDRLVKLAPVAPPKAFNAGSVFDRSSMLIVPVFDEELKMAFAKPELEGKEFQIAAAFHVREEPKPDPLLPPVIAELVNNDRPDVLATAYAPAEPDYAKASPFETLLKDDTAGSGRFIPPLAQGDHDWVSSPLPPSVFSEQEQRCLSAGIYFEARGESVKGQAAVAQVILNRVRNPTYPELDLRRRLSEREVAPPLPVLLCLRRHQGPRRQPRALRDGRGGGAGRDLGQDLDSGGRILDPLSCDLCASALGAHHGKDDEDRSPYLLPHAWRRLELRRSVTERLACRRRPTLPGFASGRPRALRQIARRLSQISDFPT